MYTYKHMYTYTYICIYIYICYRCMYTYMYMYVCVYLSLSICVYVYIYIYIYIYISYRVFSVGVEQPLENKASQPNEIHVRVLLSLQQPSFQQRQASSHRVFETCSCVFVSSEIMKCRLLKLLLDHPMTNVGTHVGEQTLRK